MQQPFETLYFILPPKSKNCFIKFSYAVTKDVFRRRQIAFLVTTVFTKFHSTGRKSHDTYISL